MTIVCMQLILALFLGFDLSFLARVQATTRHTFVVQETTYTKLCNTKKILTVNGKFPGPTLYVHKGDTIIVDVYNKASDNITIHWHGVKQPRNPWSDGPSYITQCPIQPGGNFSQKVIFSTEEGTLWWHAHSEWSRATVHGAIVVYPKEGSSYPFPKPDVEMPIMFGEWWIRDVREVYEEALITGAAPNVSDAYTINGQPGDLYPCSKSETFKLVVDYGKTYLLRLINAALQEILFFAVAGHNLTVVGTDASYTKPFTTHYIAISPGQTIDVLLKADRPPNLYYMAAKPYSSGAGVAFDNTTTTALLQYNTHKSNMSLPNLISFPYLPSFNDTDASVSFTGKLRSLSDKNHPILVPIDVTNKFLITLSINTLPCANNSCGGPNGTRLLASMNNVSFDFPTKDILSAYYYREDNGVYGDRFPDVPAFRFNYTAESFTAELQVPRMGTEVKVLEYNATVEIVFQGTNLVAGLDHPMHLHGTSFYVVGWGFGNFDEVKDPLSYNLVDPPLQNTIAVPRNGWSAIRFRAKNPGVWFMHCHIERHLTWGMKMAFIVRNGNTSESQMLPPPPDMPPC